MGSSVMIQSKWYRCAMIRINVIDYKLILTSLPINVCGGGYSDNVIYTSVWPIFVGQTLNFKIHVHWPKMKTLHFISLNSCFVSIHDVIRITHDYWDFVADDDYAYFYSIPRSFQASTPEKSIPYVARAQEQVVHLQL